MYHPPHDTRYTLTYIHLLFPDRFWRGMITKLGGLPSSYDRKGIRFGSQEHWRSSLSVSAEDYPELRDTSASGWVQNQILCLENDLHY